MELLTALALAIKHLPGQHDQASHGRGKGGSAKSSNRPNEPGKSRGTDDIFHPEVPRKTAWSPAIRSKVLKAKDGDVVYQSTSYRDASEVQHEAENLGHGTFRVLPLNKQNKYAVQKVRTGNTVWPPRKRR